MPSWGNLIWWTVDKSELVVDFVHVSHRSIFHVRTRKSILLRGGSIKIYADRIAGSAWIFERTIPTAAAVPVEIYSIKTRVPRDINIMQMHGVCPRPSKEIRPLNWRCDAVRLNFSSGALIYICAGEEFEFQVRHSFAGGSFCHLKWTENSSANRYRPAVPRFYANCDRGVFTTEINMQCFSLRKTYPLPRRSAASRH